MKRIIYIFIYSSGFLVTELSVGLVFRSTLGKAGCDEADFGVTTSLHDIVMAPEAMAGFGTFGLGDGVIIKALSRSGYSKSKLGISSRESFSTWGARARGFVTK